jgi:hypothetical protein
MAEKKKVDWVRIKPGQADADLSNLKDEVAQQRIFYDQAGFPESDGNRGNRFIRCLEQRTERTGISKYSREHKREYHH